jgi:hypothetical protein
MGQLVFNERAPLRIRIRADRCMGRVKGQDEIGDAAEPLRDLKLRAGSGPLPQRQRNLMPIPKD